MTVPTIEAREWTVSLPDRPALGKVAAYGLPPVFHASRYAVPLGTFPTLAAAAAAITKEATK